MSTPSSNIRVFVHWTEQTVFAGENVECKITFKNVAPVVGGPQLSPQGSKVNVNGFTPGGERHRKTVPGPGSTAGARNSLPPASRVSLQPQRGGHRPALSLSVSPSGNRRQGSPESWGLGQNGAGATEPPRRKHQRSVSIISIGGGVEVEGEEKKSNGQSSAGRRPSRGHTRSASLQILPRGYGGPGSPGLTSALAGNRPVQQPSPLGSSTPQISEPPDAIQNFQTRTYRQSTGAISSPNPSSISRTGRKPSGSFSQTFRFPGSPLPQRSSLQDQSGGPDSSISSRPSAPASRGNSPRPPEQVIGGLDHLPPATRILSPSSMNGTPRSSGEFYSMSNNSTETLASEYIPQTSSRLLPRPSHQRRTSGLAPTNQPRPPETLMMGYVQIMGSFTVDGSLINQAPFEEVKRKGVVGGQGGGGVVGVETSRRDSGLFGAFGWGNIGESIGGLIGGGELSSIKEMRGIANSKIIPLITTPQSILFVDLQLAPGEKKSYKYSFKLPKGLPPTHKGKAIKISYNLVIGTQRATKVRDQQVRQVELPFRVLGGVDARGELLGHDLMSPYILLKDQARTSSIDESSSESGSTLQGQQKKNTGGSKSSPNSSFEDFMSYVDTLLSASLRRGSSSPGGLLSPTAAVPSPSRRGSFIEEPTAKEAIDFAILQGNSSTHSSQTTRFEVARNGKRVAVLSLARPAYRLGETIIAAIDFEGAQIPCYALHAALESSEKVDPAIALRSGASVYRVTRRVHGSHSESTLFARRVVFSPTIPIGATPEFLTSGVSLEWKLRVEFVTPRIFAGGEEDDPGGGGDGSGGGTGTPGNGLLEEVQRDDRGIVLSAVEGIMCESFEVAVPVRVYGAVVVAGGGCGGGSGSVGRDEREVEGLVV